MLNSRKEAKRFLKNAITKEYESVISEAGLSDWQEEILSLKRRNSRIPSWEIANRYNVSPETITRELQAIYDKVSKVIRG